MWLAAQDLYKVKTISQPSDKDGEDDQEQSPPSWELLAADGCGEKETQFSLRVWSWIGWAHSCGWLSIHVYLNNMDLGFVDLLKMIWNFLKELEQRKLCSYLLNNLMAEF